MRRISFKQQVALTLVLTVIFEFGCGGGTFANELRMVLAASSPLIESLPLNSNLKVGLVTDFTDMAGGAATLGDCLNTATDKPAKLMCVQSFSTDVEAVINRGHFGQANNPRLTQILGIVRGVIASARIYYGAPKSSTSKAASKPVTEASLKAQIEALKEAMKP